MHYISPVIVDFARLFSSRGSHSAGFDAAGLDSCFAYEENQRRLWKDTTIGSGFYEVGTFK